MNTNTNMVVAPPTPEELKGELKFKGKELKATQSLVFITKRTLTFKYKSFGKIYLDDHLSKYIGTRILPMILETAYKYIDVLMLPSWEIDVSVKHEMADNIISSMLEDYDALHDALMKSENNEGFLFSVSNAVTPKHYLCCSILNVVCYRMTYKNVLRTSFADIDLLTLIRGEVEYDLSRPTYMDMTPFQLKTLLKSKSVDFEGFMSDSDISAEYKIPLKVVQRYKAIVRSELIPIKEANLLQKLANPLYK